MNLTNYTLQFNFVTVLRCEVMTENGGSYRCMCCEVSVNDHDSCLVACV